MHVLVVNAGSSTLKLRVVDDHDAVVARADLPAVEQIPPADLARELDRLAPYDAVGHRLVHGGREFRSPVLVEGDVRDRIEALTPLAPLHQPRALAALDAVGQAVPGLPTVACFDTAFHSTLPPEASVYAVPREWRDVLGVRRYGFHGLSHAYASRRAVELGANPRHVVVCHLGAGASLCAVREGRSVDTTMGFTPLEGLVMATRSGTVDPGAVLWLVTQAGLPAAEVTDALEHRSGLLGLAGSADMREVIVRAGNGDGEAGLALGAYHHRLRSSIAAMVASLGGLDTLVFTGGVGETAPVVRAAAAGGLHHLGVAYDPEANASAVPDADITGPGSHARVLVVAAREEVEIARGVRQTVT
jgi:acetate kinase